MRSIARLACAVVGAGILFGCGGDGSNPNIANVYTGTWAGSYTAPETNGTGSISLTITENGSLSGTVSGTGGLTGSFVGTVLGTGQFAATHVTSSDGYFTMINGALALTPGGGINGNFQYEWVKQHYAGAFTATGGSSTTSGTAGSDGSSSGSDGTDSGTSGSTATTSVMFSRR